MTKFTTFMGRIRMPRLLARLTTKPRTDFSMDAFERFQLEISQRDDDDVRAI